MDNTTPAPLAISAKLIPEPDDSIFIRLANGGTTPPSIKCAPILLLNSLSLSHKSITKTSARWINSGCSLSNKLIIVPAHCSVNNASATCGSLAAHASVPAAALAVVNASSLSSFDQSSLKPSHNLTLSGALNNYQIK